MSFSVTIQFVEINMFNTPRAFSNASLSALAGLKIPASTKFTYSSVSAFQEILSSGYTSCPISCGFSPAFSTILSKQNLENF